MRSVVYAIGNYILGNMYTSYTTSTVANSRGRQRRSNRPPYHLIGGGPQARGPQEQQG